MRIRDRAGCPCTKAYNKKWYGEKGKQRNATDSARRNRAAYARSARGRAIKTAAEARRRGRNCICCTRVEINELYELAQFLECEVDHCLPLAAGGIHCLSNLQILTPTEHRLKTNLDLGLIARYKQNYVRP